MPIWQRPEPREDWLQAFLTVRPPSPGPISWVSTFSAVVRDARDATGRDPETGRTQEETRSGNWLGALAYLVMFDQVGECFSRRSGTLPATERRNVVRALTDFAKPPLDEPEILAIYALRCALAHDYALVNLGQGKDARLLTHRFLLRTDVSSPLVTLPIEPWDGQLSPSRYRNQTHVNLRALGDLAERVVAEIQAAQLAGDVEIALDGGIDELDGRFGISILPDP